MCSLSSGLIYMFLLCSCCGTMVMCVLSGTFDSWFIILVSYLFFGGFMCVLAYFSSFSFSSLRFSNFSVLAIGLLTCSSVVLTSKRLFYKSMNEMGVSWDNMHLLSFFGCFMLLIVMYSVIAVSKEGWGGVRMFSL